MFIDRSDAGRQLAQRLSHLKGDDVVVLGLPRGGVPVAYHVALALDAPLDVIVVRKLGVPYQPELGMGAIGEGGVRVLNPDVMRMAGVSDSDLMTVEVREREELQRRAERFRGVHPPVSLSGRTAIVVDDGIATGSTARAACAIARAHGARRVVLAVPVAPRSALELFHPEADEVVCVDTPTGFSAIGQWYQDFTQTSDEEVVSLLQQAGARASMRRPAIDLTDTPYDDEVAIPVGVVRLGGRLVVPRGAPGIVVFAHGSGSSRHSTRNRYVAEVLNGAGIGTLLFDLLTEAEESDRSKVFDIHMLSRRLAAATAWLREQPAAQNRAIGYFGASTGAAAALCAAALPGADIAAVVSRGGRPDLAMDALGDVTAPTLLIVGGADTVVLDLNREAERHLRCERRVVVVPGATHLFEEPGALEEVARLAQEWFARNLVATGRTVGRR